MKSLANERKKKKVVSNQPAAVQQIEPQVMNDAIIHPMRTLFAPVDVAHHYVDAYRNGNDYYVSRLAADDIPSLEDGQYVSSGALFQRLLLELDRYNSTEGRAAGEKVTLLAPETWAGTHTYSHQRLRQHWGEAANCTFLCRDSFQRAVVPINYNNIHWLLGILDFQKHKIYVYDSLPRILNNVSEQKDKIYKSLNDIYDALASIRQLPTHNVQTVLASPSKVCFQTDGYNCGIFTIAHAMNAIMRGPQARGCPDATFRSDRLLEIRMDIKDELMRFFPEAPVARPQQHVQNATPQRNYVDLRQYISPSPSQTNATMEIPVTTISAGHARRSIENKHNQESRRISNVRATTTKFLKKSGIKIRPGKRGKRDPPFNLATYVPDPEGYRSGHLQPTKHKWASNRRDTALVKKHCAHTRCIRCPYCKDSYLFPGETSKFCCSTGAASTKNVPNPLSFSDELLMCFDRDYQKQKNIGDIQAQSIKLNQLFQMASTTGAQGEANGKGRRTLNTNGAPVVIVQGSIKHKVSTLIPPRDAAGNERSPTFAQVYCIDGTDKQTDLRMDKLRSFSGANIPRAVIKGITEFIEKHNPLAKSFKMAFELYRERCENNEPAQFEKLIVLTRKDVRNREEGRQGADLHERQILQLNSVNEVYIPDPDHQGPSPVGTWFQFKRDTFYLRELPFFDENTDPLCYPILFPGGEKGYGSYIDREQPKTKKKIPKGPTKCPLCDTGKCSMTIVDSSGTNYGFEDDYEDAAGGEVRQEQRSQRDEREDTPQPTVEPVARDDFDDECANLQAPEVEPNRTEEDFRNGELCPRDIDMLNSILAEEEDDEEVNAEMMDESEDEEENEENDYTEQDDYVLGAAEEADVDEDEDADLEDLADSIEKKGRKYLSAREFLRFRLRRAKPGTFHFFTECGRLGQLYIIDSCQRIESRDIEQMKTHMKIRAEAAEALRYVLQRRLQRITNSDVPVGRIFLLPYTYPGGKAYMQRKFLDAMAISARVGAPSFFITFTGNPKWPEVLREQRHKDQPLTELYDIQCRVFLRKLYELKKDLLQCFGEQVGMAMSIEHQQRGMPHAHILLTIHPEDYEVSGEHIDEYITTNVPDKDENPELFNLVTSLMHHYCATDKHKCRKKVNEKDKNCKQTYCSRGFPKPYSDGSEHCFVGFRSGRQVALNVPADDGYGVHPSVMNPRADGIVVDYDEAEHVDLFRTLSAHEAYLRIMGVQITYTSHFVDFLPVHAEGNRFVTYRENADDQEIAEQLLKESKLEAFFAFWKENYRKPKRCREKPMTYPEFAECYRFDYQERKWVKRSKKRPVIARVQAVPLGKQELFAMRALLMVTKAPKSFEDLRGKKTTYAEKATELGLIDSPKFWDDYLAEVVKFAKRPKDIRAAFARLVTMGCHPNPIQAYQTFKKDMFRPNIHQTAHEAKKIGIRDLERRLRRFGRSLVEFGEDEVDRFFRESDSLYPELEDRNGDIDYDGIREQGDQDFEILNDDQKNIVRTIEEAVQYRHLHNQQRLFELNGSGGTGKTLTINTLIRRLIGQGKKVIVCASTGIAATLLVSGKTVHSAFKVAPNRPVPQYSAHTEQGKKVMEAEVIIWDEITMSNRTLINAIDQHCRDVLPNIDDHKETAFGGKVVLVCGDWKQLLPVVEGAAAPIEQLRASFKYTASIDKFKTLKLTRNMRIGPDEESYRHYTERVGNGYYMLDGTLAPKKQRFIPPHRDSHQVFSSGDLLSAVFPDELLSDKDRYEELGTRAILAAHNENVDRINAEALRKVPGASTIYEAIDEPAVDCPFTSIFSTMDRAKEQLERNRKEVQRCRERLMKSRLDRRVAEEQEQHLLQELDAARSRVRATKSSEWSAKKRLDSAIGLFRQSADWVRRSRQEAEVSQEAEAPWWEDGISDTQLAPPPTEKKKEEPNDEKKKEEPTDEQKQEELEEEK
ncbi:hypothetical protein QR680_012481 [Steinernema hermaphroditum]|uniref:ATP-dependent DNA helicase n=1 Tax=Steinernema hermaphroditum TaxID=289476 RepID=A0AA39M0T9_9BILA|nr:hypothetical protein QR680_012481 [Steinernema hermaphroditum]